MLDDWTDAERIFFLGFGYHDMNLKLFLPVTGTVRPMVLGTTVAISHSNQDRIRAALKSFFPSGTADLMLLSLPCANMLQDHWRLLTKNSFDQIPRSFRETVSHDAVPIPIIWPAFANRSDRLDSTLSG